MGAYSVGEVCRFAAEGGIRLLRFEKCMPHGRTGKSDMLIETYKNTREYSL